MKKISIITPSLNQHQYLEQAIKSALDQAGDFYLELIVADGGSKDGSIGIIKKYDELLRNKKYPISSRGIELRWWSEKDGGQTQALNKGFKNSSGDICAWINSDDYYAPGAFQKVFDVFNDHPGLDLVYGNVTEILADGTVRKGEARQSGFELNLREGCQISQQGAFFTRPALERAGYLDEDYQYCMDYDLWLKILKNGRAKFIPDELAFFRIWPGSKTSNYEERFKAEEDRIRRKHGGSRVNPGSIHRWRVRQAWIGRAKTDYPRIYGLIKRTVYGIINLFKYRHD